LNTIANIALVGNPNSGKTSLFNALTGLNQRVGNFAGVTVDKKTGDCTLPNKRKVNIIDLPGTYSLYPKSGDEFVAYNALFDFNIVDKPDAIVVLVDASNLKRNLLFCTQIIDLGFPIIVALSMVDIASKKGIVIDTDALSIQLGVPIISINPRKNKGIVELKKQIQQTLSNTVNYKFRESISNIALAPEAIAAVKKIMPHLTDYACLHMMSDADSVRFLTAQQSADLLAVQKSILFNKTKVQVAEVMQRYAYIKQAMKVSVQEDDPLKKEMRTEQIDKLLLHPLWGNIVLLFILFLLFQSIFWLASFPMAWIDGAFSTTTAWLTNVLPNNLIADLFVNGILAGFGGIIMFVPQIMILFGLITLLEDTGYMARISFLTDRLMRSAGLNGKAVLPLISGMACAVPAIMGARTIENKKERLITIMITPLMSCSARLPVYTILIALVIPSTTYLGIISLQGLVMMALYLLGFVVALLIAKLLDVFIKIKEKSIFLMELPVYRAPRWSNIGITMLQKAKIFVQDAGKIIMIISVILWVLCNFGPASQRESIIQKYKMLSVTSSNLPELKLQQSSELLEHSYAGIIGKTIEPAIAPLGFDWKIGIALITSFAAREVFVGTMSTIYSVGADDANPKPLLQKMSEAVNAKGEKVYTLASGISLLLFYVFAMQCMSTIAIVKRETGSWKYALIQFVYMEALAFLFSFVAYKILSLY
jgi:ferrous iron transport protein B